MPNAPRTLTNGKRTDYRGPASKRGYSTQWNKLWKWFIAQHPLCIECEHEGQSKRAEEVDHVIPVKQRPDLLLSVDNLQSLCRRHHALKTHKEHGR